MIRAIILAGLVAAASAGAQEFTVQTDHPDRWREARLTAHQAWFERADDLLGELLALEPDLAMAWGYGALVDAMLYRDVEPRAARAEELAADAPPGERRLVAALAAFARGELEACESHLEAFLTDFPDDPYARHVLGFTRIDLGRPADGLEVLADLMADRPDYTAANNHLGYALLDLGRQEEALAAFAAFAAGWPGNPSAHDSLADGYLALGRLEEAIAHLARALLLERRFAYGWLHMGDVMRVTNDVALAEQAYERALSVGEALYGPGFQAVVQARLAEIRP